VAKTRARNNEGVTLSGGVCQSWKLHRWDGDGD